MKAIYWLKRDFRLLDNQALRAGLDQVDHLSIIYMVEPSMLEAPETSEFHIHAITGAYNDMRSKVTTAGGKMGWMHTETVAGFARLFEQQPFDALYSHEEIGVDRTYKRDIAVAQWCRENGVKWYEYRQTGVFRWLSDRDKRARLWREHYSEEIIAAPDAEELKRLGIPDSYSEVRTDKLVIDFADRVTSEHERRLQAVSESSAVQTLQSFLHERGIAYRGGISSPVTALTAGSRMSVHLAWGSMSGRVVYQRTQERRAELKDDDDPMAKRWRSSLTAFTARLHWRDHFIQRLETEPQMEYEPLNSAYSEIVYDAPEEHVTAWYEGRTGFPMVDACVRCLRATGFINFRMRALLTSTACHVLHIDWKRLDPLMARLYTDYEPGIHLSQLQMQAAVVGINTIRVYSPHKQIIDQDPDATFIHEWIPELQEYSPIEIQAHRMDDLGLYPGQVVDYVSASKAMKSQLYSVKGRKVTKEIAQKVYLKHGSRKAPSSKRRKSTASKSK